MYFCYYVCFCVVEIVVLNVRMVDGVLCYGVDCVKVFC